MKILEILRLLWLTLAAMGDVHFSCPGCAQSLVVEDTGAGLTINCPHCAKLLQIPFPVRDESEARASQKLSKWINRANELERELYDSQTQLGETRRESERRQTALAETLQELRVAKSEWETLLQETERTRDDRERLLAELRTAQTNAANAQVWLTELQAERDRLDMRAEQAELELSQKQKQFEAASVDRTKLLTDFTHKTATVSNLSAELDTVRLDRSGLEMKVQRASSELTRAQEQLTELQTENEKLSSDLVDVRDELRHLQSTFALTKHERDQLVSDVKQDRELSDFLSLKAGRARLEGELRDAQVVLSDTREKLNAASSERDTLRRESVELQLKLSALRDSASDPELRRDNELLRGIIERLNEELKERPAPRRRRHKKENSTTRLGDLVRAVWARCFISDPGTT